MQNSGIARGCGWQKIGAIVNLGAYYLWGIPAGIFLAFVYHVGGKVLIYAFHFICSFFFKNISLNKTDDIHIF